jgi:2,5-diamino-6-(ribosylamino)-4(3H)-pyrimidinone 5'-phosphate reductase
MEKYPRVIVYNAVSVDGRIDNFNADIGLYYELAAKWPHEAILAGAGTILTDTTPDPAGVSFDAPVNDPSDLRPILVVPDSRGRIKNWLFLRQQPYWKNVLALVSKTTPQSYLDYLWERHIDFIAAGEDHVDFKLAFAELQKRYGIKAIRVDSGGTLNGVLLREGLVDEVSVLVHPVLVGGISPSSIFRAPDCKSPEESVKLELTHVEQLRDGIVWLKYRVKRG